MIRARSDDEAFDRFGAVVEDPPQVAADEEALGELAERPERDRVADAVVDHGRRPSPSGSNSWVWCQSA